MISRSVYEFCCEDISKIENFEKAVCDRTQSWHCHHRLETHDENGNKRLKNLPLKVLQEKNLYFNRPASELIFLTKSDHQSIHRKGYSYTDEEKKELSKKFKKLHEEHPEIAEKISKKLKGRKYTEEEYAAHANQYELAKHSELNKELGRRLGLSNIGRKQSEESKEKNRQSQKKIVHTQEWINNAANAHRGKKHNTTNLKWFTNGITNYRGAECPDGYRPGKVHKNKSVESECTGTITVKNQSLQENVLKVLLKEDYSASDTK